MTHTFTAPDGPVFRFAAVRGTVTVRAAARGYQGQSPDSLVSKTVIIRGDTAWVWVRDSPRAVSARLVRVERRYVRWVAIRTDAISIQ